MGSCFTTSYKGGADYDFLSRGVTKRDTLRMNGVRQTAVYLDKANCIPRTGVYRDMERVRQNGVSFFDVVSPKPGRTTGYGKDGSMKRGVDYDVVLS